MQGTRDKGSVLGSGRSLGGGNNPLQYSCLENPINKGAWRATVHGVAKSQTRVKRLSIAPGLCEPELSMYCHSGQITLIRVSIWGYNT